MYHFGVVALMALATVKLVDVVADTTNLDRFRSWLTFAVSMAAMWVMDYSLFDGWGVAVRDHDMGVLMTGLMTAGMTVPWRAMFGWLTHDHAKGDETLGEVRHMRAA